MDPPDPSPPQRICASTCHQTFGLRDTDLVRIPVIYARNPWNRRNHVRPYNLQHVEQLAETVAREREQQHHQKKIDAALEAEQKASDQLARRKNAQRVMDNYACDVIHQTPNAHLPLPLDAMGCVAQALARRDNNTFRGWTECARDLASLAMVCRETRVAAQQGFREMARACPNVASSNTVDWNVVIANPMAHTVSVLKRAAQALNRRVGGTKAELAHRVVEAIGCPYNRPGAPACVVYACKLDRDPTQPTWADPCIAALRCRLTSVSTAAPENLALAREVTAVGANRGVARVRAWLCERFGCLECVFAFVEGAATKEAERSESQRQAVLCARMVKRQARSDAISATDGNAQGMCTCVCGQTVSWRCVNGVCGTCCKSGDTRCEFHKGGG